MWLVAPSEAAQFQMLNDSLQNHLTSRERERKLRVKKKAGRTEEKGDVREEAL